MAAKANRRKRTRPPRRWKLELPRLRVNLRALLGPPALVGLAFAVYALAYPLLDRPVSELVIEAPFQRVSALAIEQAAAGELERGFLSTDLDRVRREVEALDWVDRAIVSRAWPDRVVISVSEHRAAARWGQTGLLNVRGELFTDNARHAYPELPRLHGPPGSETEVAGVYLAARGRLAATHLALESLSMDARGAFLLELEGGLSVRLGRERVSERLDRLFRVVAPTLEGSLERVEYVDLRYTNGFAVGWSDGEPGERFLSSLEGRPRA